MVGIIDAGPAGHYVVTVTAADNCGAQSERTFDLDVVYRSTAAAPALSWPMLAVLAATLLLIGWRTQQRGAGARTG